MIKNIVFDVGNVILNFPQDEILKKFAKSEEEYAFLEENVINSPEWLGESLMDADAVSLAQAIHNVQERTNHERDDLIENFWLNYTQHQRIDGVVINIIKKLKKRGYKVYLLSNMNPQNYILISLKSDLFEIVDGMVLSFMVGQTKPNQAIYKTLLGKYDLKAEECVFIDDSQDNIDMGLSLGFDARKVRQNNYNDVYEAVKNF